MPGMIRPPRKGNDMAHTQAFYDTQYLVRFQYRGSKAQTVLSASDLKCLRDGEAQCVHATIDGFAWTARHIVDATEIAA